MKQKYSLFKFGIVLTLMCFIGMSVATGQTLVHSYDFEDGTANDVVGTAHGTLNGTGAIAGGVYTSAANGDFISFDGTALALNAMTSITMEAYVRGGGGTNPSWSMFAYFGGLTGNNAYWMSIARGDDISLTEYWPANVAGPELEDGNLHHLVSILTSTGISFYIDGAHLGTTPSTRPLSEISTENAWLCKGGWPDATWNGSIYEFNIYEGELDPTTIFNSAIAFTGDSRLSDLTSDVGSLNPVFGEYTSEYELVVPTGTTTVNLTATKADATATVTGDGAIDISSGAVTDTVKVVSANGESERLYIVHIAVGEADCYTPLFSNQANIIDDPGIVSLSNFAGWGNKSLNTDPAFVYCGATSGKVAGTNGGSIDFDLDATGILKPDTKYRVKAMVYVVGTGDFQIGFWGLGVDEFAFPTTLVDTWETIDTVFTTGATLTDNMGTYFNNYNKGGDVGYIDNWELYEVTEDSTLTDLMVNGVSVAGFDPLTYTYDAVAPNFDVPVVTATTTGADASVMVLNPEVMPGSVIVDVTAEDGIATETYTINFTVAAPVLMHSYDFEDGTANDVVGTANGTIEGTGTISGGIYTSAADGDYITFVGTELALDTYNSITTEIFVRAGDGTNPSWSMLNYFGGANGDNAYFTSIARNDDITLTEYHSAANVPGPELDDGKMHHIVSVLTNGRITLYIDGVLMGNGYHSKAISTMKMDNALLCRGGWPDPSWLGSIYEYNIYEGEVDAATVLATADAFLAPSDTRLSALAVDVGTLTPEFNANIAHYAIAVPTGTTTVNVTGTVYAAGATISGDGAVDISGGATSDTVKVTSQDGLETREYTLDILFEADCFTPLYADKTNLIPDPEMTDVSLMGGWGSKSTVYGHEAYCGLTAAKLLGPGCSSALDLSNHAWKANTAYRVNVMVKTIDGSIGILAKNTDPDFGFALDTYGEWLELDTVFMTGANPTTGFFSFNACDYGSNCTVAYIDNYELYEVELDTTLSDLQVSGATVSGFDAATFSYDVELAHGTTEVPAVTATANDVYAEAVVTAAAALPGSTTVVVTAVDGTTTGTYTINFTTSANPPAADITFIVDDTDLGTATGFAVKGSWATETGVYDASWSGGAEHSVFYDDGTNGDATAGDHIWTVTLALVPDDGANTWEWGVNDADGNWIDGNFQFTVPDATAQTLDPFVIVGIDHNRISAYSIYPNPASSEVHIDKAEEISKVEVISITGRQALQKLNTGSSTITLSVDELPAGVYIIKITDMSNQFSHQRLIVE